LNVTPHVHSEAIELLKVLDSMDLFRTLSLNQSRELLQCAQPRHYKEGAAIIETGTIGKEFFIITAGVVNISGPNWEKNLVIGDYFGEMSLVTGTARSASAIAQTDVDIVAYSKEDFLSILRGHTETIDFILKLSQRRQEPSWQVISNNAVLHRMTNAQKTKLQASLQKKDVKKGESIWQSEKPMDFCYLIAEGEAAFKDKDLAPFKSGAFLGEINALLSGKEIYSTTLEAITDGWGYGIPKNDLISFFDHYPGIKLCFLDTIFVDALSGGPQAREEDEIPF